MKEQIYKFSTITFVIINIWTLYMFFDYFTEKSTMLHGLGLYFNFIYSLIYACRLGSVLMIVRLFLYLRKKTNPLKSNFFYIFCGIFNLNLFFIWLICISLNILDIDTGLIIFLAIGSLLISSFIIFDIYKSSFKIQKNN